MKGSDGHSELDNLYNEDIFLLASKNPTFARRLLWASCRLSALLADEDWMDQGDAMSGWMERAKQRFSRNRGPTRWKFRARIPGVQASPW